MMTRRTIPANSVGWTTKALGHSAQPLEKPVVPAQRRVHFACMCKGKKKPRDPQQYQKSSAKYVRQEEQEEISDSDFAFQLRADKSNTLNHATV